MQISLELNADQAALLCGTLERAANQYPDSDVQRQLFETVETAVDNAESMESTESPCPVPPRRFEDYLPLDAVRFAPGEYEIKSRGGHTLWVMEGASLADWVCQSVNGYDSLTAEVGRLRGAIRTIADHAHEAVVKGKVNVAGGQELEATEEFARAALK